MGGGGGGGGGGGHPLLLALLNAESLYIYKEGVSGGMGDWRRKWRGEGGGGGGDHVQQITHSQSCLTSRGEI